MVVRIQQRDIKELGIMLYWCTKQKLFTRTHAFWFKTKAEVWRTKTKEIQHNFQNYHYENFV